MSPELQALLDKQSITEALYTYCRAVDRIDPELGYTIWHEGAQADYGRIYQGDARGLIDFICNSHKHGIVHSHQITNILIRLGGDTARSEAYITSAMRLMHEGEFAQARQRGSIQHLRRRGGRGRRAAHAEGEGQGLQPETSGSSIGAPSAAHRGNNGTPNASAGGHCGPARSTDGAPVPWRCFGPA